MKNHKFFPMFVDISQKRILVIGAGKIATRRIKILTDFANKITVVSPHISDEIQKLMKQGLINVRKREFCESDLQDADIVLAATNDRELNEKVGKSCLKNGIPVSVASHKELCSFYFPGIIKKDELVIGITASGEDHKKAKSIREKINENLNQWIE
ncbi:precorrin-2 dehydrogenase/sirohydrochlorin ferrochelatase family protein [Anaerosacchariphilus polymeriproducens]|uniref:precorrin-2 dehydrogenase n=1 Tax=Anaerosacchariphilus polymeriproducens TaxID=1812858 RepID=A0A371AYD6_9FIRM|nr:bifunctional precorrin-2 dehydrogenase/sirohydrochlorin ferrochelatase [Anaerosacchariphilus polymeriproducens]RDU24549.1 bifunctional precorrin-2 dehydrogenase/sirohydrochlorin ferrochelatase [Anaerosacchariphilus polymeriproducens]